MTYSTHPQPQSLIAADDVTGWKNSTVIAGLLALVVTSLVPVATTIYRDAYPADLQRRQALDQCAASDDNFSRLLAADRRACYQQFPGILPSDQPPDTNPRLPVIAANFVDLWQASGRGHLPPTDVRMEAESAAVAGLSHATPR